MSSLISRTTFLAAAASLALAGPSAVAAEHPDPECAALENSALAMPEWYPAQCGSGEEAAPTVSGPWRVPGDLGFYCTLFSTNAALSRRLLSAPLPTNTYTNIAPCSAAPLSLFAVDFDNAAAVLWAIDSGTCGATCTLRNFGTINQTTGAFTVVGAIAAPPNGPAIGANFAGIRFDPTDGTVYVASIAGGVSQLWSLNTTTGMATLRGPMPGGIMIDIAIDNSGQMYALNISTDTLNRIDKATGAVTVVGPTNFDYNFAQGMDFDASDNTLYVFGQGIAAGLAHIGRANLTTGAVTILTVTGEEMEGAVKVAATRMTPLALAVDTAGNLVMDPAETVVVAPTWRNDGSQAQAGVTGTFSAFTGPAGGVYTIVDASGNYGTIAAGGSATCATPADCYSVMADAAARPVQHWDTTVLESLSVTGQSKTWTLHVGGSFTDVPTSNIFYRFIETIFHKAITGGCGTGIYCPASSTSREQMAVFVLIAKEGAGYTPPACVPPNLFSDVAETSPFCRFIEEIANRGVVTGCGPNLYCPTNPVTREQMAVFALRTLEPTFTPPDCPTPSVFADVPASSPFCRYIEELARRGVVAGCGGTPPNYCPSNPVTREQMGVFLTATFSLTLYGI